MKCVCFGKISVWLKNRKEEKTNDSHLRKKTHYLQSIFLQYKEIDRIFHERVTYHSQNKNLYTTSDMSAVMNFELLPDEMLIECFKYLDAADIFHSFDHLNWRFFTLIRDISLHLDLGKVDSNKLAQFGVTMLLTPKLKEKIKSLTLKKNDTFNGIQMLFSFASLHEFSQLETFVLSNMDTPSTNQYCSMLPLLYNLQHLSIENPSDSQYVILQPLSNLNLETLSIYTIPDTASYCHFFMSLTHLTISSCSVNALCHFFKYSPGLKYLKIKDLSSSFVTSSNELQLRHEQAMHLDRLIIHDCSDEFDFLQMLAERTPNLKVLVFRSSNQPDLLDEHRWRQLIENSLPRLDVFKFLFRFDIEDEHHDFVSKFKLFQNAFWHDQHHWYTECVLNNKEALIYTIPWMFDTYEITPNTNRYYFHKIDKTKVFTKVTNLTVNMPTLIDIDQYYFPNITSLRLINDRVDEMDHHSPQPVESKYTPSLTTGVNLSRLNHLEISSKCHWISTSIILQLIGNASRLSSFKTDPTILFLLFKSGGLQCLKTIKRLDVTGNSSNKQLGCEEIENICQTFPNMEKFRCCIVGLDVLQATIDHLSKLPFMRAFSYSASAGEYAHDWLEAHRSDLDSYPFTINCENCEIGCDFNEYNSNLVDMDGFVYF